MLKKKQFYRLKWHDIMGTRYYSNRKGKKKKRVTSKKIKNDYFCNLKLFKMYMSI